MNIEDLVQQLLGSLESTGDIRYGMPTGQKAGIALRRELPGAPPVEGAEADNAQRYAAGYLHSQHMPEISQYTQPVATFLHALGRVPTPAFPGLTFGEESPELNSFGQYGHNMGQLKKKPQPQQGDLIAALMAMAQ